MPDASAQMELYVERLALILESADAPSLADAETLARMCHFPSHNPPPEHDHLTRGTQRPPRVPTSILRPSTGLVLREYQNEADEAVLASLVRGEHPVVRMPTGSGKSLCIAELCRLLPGRILVATHRKRLLQQNSAQLTKLLGIGEDIGIYSAGLQQRDTAQRVIFGGVASIYRRMHELQDAGNFNYVIVDEVHLVPPRSVTNSMYAQVFQGIDPMACQLIGFSATPSRMGVPVWGAGQWFSHLAVDISMASLTPEYLCPLVGVLTAADADLSGVRIAKGEFVQADASQAMSEESVAKAALDEACLLAAQRQHWFLFTCDQAHSRLVANLLADRGISAAVVISDQESAENDAALAAFEAGEVRALVSVSMLTTGIDVPHLDCIILLSPTMSKERLIQELGRGTRQAQGKENCLVLDYASNLDRHAPLEELAQVQRTEQRIERDSRRADEAKAREEKERQARHQTSVFTSAPETYRVTAQRIEVRPSKKYPDQSIVQVSYCCPTRMAGRWVSLWLCPTYPGYPRRLAEAHFTRRGLACPRSAETAAALLRRSAPPTSIRVIQDGQWARVTLEYFEEENDHA
jgi:DNA repair protein RadD